MSSGPRDVGSTRHWRVHSLSLSPFPSSSSDSPSLSSSSLKLIKHPGGRESESDESWCESCAVMAPCLSCDNTMLRDNGSDFLRPIVALSCIAESSRRSVIHAAQTSTSFDFVHLNDFPILRWYRSRRGNHSIIQLSAPLTFSSAVSENKRLVSLFRVLSLRDVEDRR